MITIRRIAATGLTLAALTCLAVPAQAAATPPTAPAASHVTAPLPDALATGQHRSVDVAGTDQIVIVSCQPTTTRPGWAVPVTVTPADHGAPEHASADVPGVDVSGLYGPGLGWPVEVLNYSRSHLAGRSGCVTDLAQLPVTEWGAYSTLAGGPGLSVPAGTSEAILPGAATTPRPASPVSTDRTAPPSASPSVNSCNPGSTGGLGGCLRVIVPGAPDTTSAPADPAPGTDQSLAPTDTERAAPASDGSDAGGFGVWAALLAGISILSAVWSRRSSRGVQARDPGKPTRDDYGTRVGAVALAAVSTLAMLIAIATGVGSVAATILTAVAALPALALARGLTARPLGHLISVTTLVRAVRGHPIRAAIGVVAGGLVGCAFGWPQAAVAGALVGVAAALARAALRDVDAALGARVYSSSEIADVLGVREQVLLDGEMTWRTVPGGGYETGRLVQAARLALDGIEARCEQRCPTMYVAEATVDRVVLRPVTDEVRQQRADRARGLGDVADVDPWSEPARTAPVSDRVDMAKPCTQPTVVDLSDEW